MVYGELGRHHLSILASTRWVKYWLRLNKLSSNRYSRMAYNMLKGAGIAQLVVLGLTVHSVAGSILLWGHFPVEGIFPLELTWVQTPFPPKLLRMRV